ncbi:hypothetical protein [Streptomyces celluloflavus]|uniref:hypothetical protein n=1 Tax=Streptomyces celluloflavus TaxID=58344 RepID=UPI00346084C2|nr:hypothetical protein OG717_29905 [Streptomyces celluloflavus]
MGVITEQIERRFHMSLPELRRAVAAAPQAHPEATDVVHWHGLLTKAQEALETAEDALVAVLGAEPGELDDPAMNLARQVNAAVSVRDGRAMVVRFLLDPDAPGKRGPGAWRGAVQAAGRGPALPTSPPVRPAPAASVRGMSR